MTRVVPSGCFSMNMPVGRGVAVGARVAVGEGVTVEVAVGVNVLVGVGVSVANGLGRFENPAQDRMANARTAVKIMKI